MLELSNLNPPYTRTDFLPQREQKDGYILKLLLEDEQRKADNSSLHAPNISYYRTFGDLFDLEKDLQKAVKYYNDALKRAMDLGFLDPKAAKYGEEPDPIQINEKRWDDNYPHAQISTGRIQIVLHENDIIFHDNNLPYMVKAIYATVQRDLLEAKDRLQKVIDKFEDKFPGYLNRDALENKSTLGY